MVCIAERYLTRQKRPDNWKVKSGYIHRGWPVVGFVVAIALAVYPVYVFPLYHVHKYKEIQEKARATVKQEEVQPGGMRVWSDPFKPQANKKK